MVINGAIVSDLDMMYLESVLQEELSLVMMMRYLYTSTLFIFTSVAFSVSIKPQSFSPYCHNPKKEF